MTVSEDYFFRQTALRICSHLEIEKAMLSCMKYLKPFMPADLISLQNYRPELGSMQMVATATAKEGKKYNILVPFSPAAREAVSGRIATFMKWGAPHVLISNRPENDPAFETMLRFFGKKYASILTMGLVMGGKPLGSLALYADGHSRYTQEHAQLFSLLREPFGIAMINTLAYREVLKLKDILADDNRFLHQELFRLSGDHIVGEEFGLKKVMEMVRQVASHDIPVLLLGETGVGKDVIANAIHHLSARKDGPFITVNCGAIPDTLLDSELFGHEKGAFTGAVIQKRGRFERAERGTIFLDEIGEMPFHAQIRLLRVLQNREIERVGGSKSIPVDIRVIVATNRDLEKMVKNKQFREDLWFRLNAFPIMIPPLRERKKDIPALVRYFIGQKTKEIKLPVIPELGEGAIDRLTAYHWPGNVRELENVVERAMILSGGDPLQFENLSYTLHERKASLLSMNEERILGFDELITDYLHQILRISNGKVHGPGGASELTRLKPSTLRYKMNKLGIKYGRRK